MWIAPHAEVATEMFHVKMNFCVITVWYCGIWNRGRPILLTDLLDQEP